jgi:hypothetical protein
MVEDLVYKSIIKNCCNIGTFGGKVMKTPKCLRNKWYNAEQSLYFWQKITVLGYSIPKHFICSAKSEQN